MIVLMLYVQFPIEWETIYWILQSNLHCQREKQRTGPSGLQTPHPGSAASSPPPALTQFTSPYVFFHAYEKDPTQILTSEVRPFREELSPRTPRGWARGGRRDLVHSPLSCCAISAPARSPSRAQAKGRRLLYGVVRSAEERLRDWYLSE